MRAKRELPSGRVSTPRRCAAGGLVMLGLLTLAGCGRAQGGDASVAPKTPAASASSASTVSVPPVPITPTGDGYSDPVEVQTSFNTPNNPQNLSYTSYPFNLDGHLMSRDEYIKSLQLPVSTYPDPKSATLAFINKGMGTLFKSGQSQVDLDTTENSTTHEVLFMPSPNVVPGTASATHFFYEPAFAEALIDSKGYYGQGIKIMNATADEFSALYSMSRDSRAVSSQPYRMTVSASPEDVVRVRADPNMSLDSEAYVAVMDVNVHFSDNGSKTDRIVNRRAKHNLPADWRVTQEISFNMVVRNGQWKLGDLSGLDLEAAVSGK